MLAAIALTLVGVAFLPVTAQTTAQPAQVFVRDSAAPAQTDPSAGGMHDAGLRPPADTDSPNAQLTNAHGDPLNVSIAGWHAATGDADLQPLAQGGGTRVRASFHGLIPMGRYSLFVRQLAGRVGVVLTPVDIVAKEAIREFVARVNRERGTTFILTTHDLADVERLCRRIVLIDRGTLVYDGEIELLRDRYGTHRTLVVTLAERADALEVDGAEIESREGDVWRLRFDRRHVSAEVLIRRVADRYCVSDLSIEEPELESIIRRIYLEGYTPEDAGAEAVTERA